VGRTDLLQSHEEVHMQAVAKITSAECPVCKRPVADHHTTIRVHGVTFHAYCAGYRRRVTAAA
jgi:hypothetical protein